MAAIEWNDVHIDEGFVHVHRSQSMHSSDHGRMKPTKTGTTRRIPIEPTLTPLLEAMKKESGGKGSVVKMPTESPLPRQFRVYLARALEAASIPLGDLFTADATRMQIDWRRATRDTGITWRAMRGDSPMKIMRSAGHRDVKTTMRYVIEAEGIGKHGSRRDPVAASDAPRAVDPSTEPKPEGFGFSFGFRRREPPQTSGKRLELSCAGRI
jgi:integrase